MRNYIDEDIISNELKQLRSDPEYRQVSFLLLEGDSDRKFYGNLIDHSKCYIEIAPSQVESNRAFIIKTIEILNRDGFEGVLGIVDRDFDAISGVTTELENLILTDDHDLEVLLVRSPALLKLLREYASTNDQQPEQSKKIDPETLDQEIDSYRQKLVDAAVQIGYLRWISVRDGLNLRFNELDKKYGKFLKKENLTIDVAELIKTVKAHSQRPDIDNNQLQDALQTVESQNLDVWQICCGHDLAAILSIALQKLWGSHSTKEVAPEIMERELRLAYDRNFFKDTQIFASIKTWEAQNMPYQVLLEF